MTKFSNRLGGLTTRRKLARPSAAAPRQSQLGYDAAEASTRRKAPSATLVSEDEHLGGNKRAKLIGGVRDLVRNFTVATWMIRKHLDFVASFNFQSRTGDDGLDEELEQFMRRRSTKENADVRRVHPLRRLVRMSEARATIDGDIAWLKVRDGSVQAIEGDRIRDPEKIPTGSRWFQGINVDDVGQPIQMAIHRRDGKGFILDRVVPWSNLFFHSAYDTHHRFDVTRGVGPIVTAIDELRDLYEAKTYALAKLKVAQMFGLVIYSDSLDGAGSHAPTGEGSDNDGDGTLEQERYKVDFGKGPIKLELDAGDKAEFLQAGVAASETIAFLSFCIDVALKALDIPRSFYDESFTNFFGQKTALTLYLQSADRKRQNMRDLLNAWSAWQFTRAVGEGEIVLPRSTPLDRLLDGSRFEWIPSGLPWFDRSREVAPAIKAIGAGLDTHSRVCRELYGMRFEDLLVEAERDQRLVRERGVVLPEFSTWATAPADEPIEPIVEEPTE